MSSSFQDILPRLKDVMLASITISNRTLSVLLDYPSALDTATLPCFINRFSLINQTGSMREFRTYNVQITCTLYSHPVTSLALLSQYNSYAYLDQFTDMLMVYPNLESSNIGLTGVTSDLSLLNARAPLVLPYPTSTQEMNFVGAEFIIGFEFQKSRDDC